MNENQPRSYVFNTTAGHVVYRTPLCEADAQAIIRILLEAQEAAARPNSTVYFTFFDEGDVPNPVQLFETGLVFVSRLAWESFPPDVIDAYLVNHVECRNQDWPDMPDANELALLNSGPVVSGFGYTTRKTCYIVTETDRSRTMVMMEEEFELLEKARNSATAGDCSPADR
ncbi:MAG: hypothetical protein HY287_02480 [Planctomycetes bacterium]|nr:hypothetical protein [Planctomycetota bacterium]MBI3833176.1 hypothetical protein [Planctomycetota bacterium]